MTLNNSHTRIDTDTDMDTKLTATVTVTHSAGEHGGGGERAPVRFGQREDCAGLTGQRARRGLGRDSGGEGGACSGA